MAAFAQRALGDKVALNSESSPAPSFASEDEKGVWQIGQLPQVEAIRLADPRNGAVLALVGGFDFIATSTTHHQACASPVPA